MFRITLKKISIKTFTSGIDFLGWVNFPKYKVIRTRTKQRMFKKIAAKPQAPTITSYLGLLRHGKAQKIQNKILEQFGDNLVS